MAELLDRLEANGRFALLKLATGGLRVGVSARLAKTALAQAFGLDVEAVEEVWHGISPPYQPLFDWAEGRADQPTAGNTPVFRTFMLAHPLEARPIELAANAVEWKWDGIRAHIALVQGQAKPYNSHGDDTHRRYTQ